jgi:hypothetical protein
MQIYEKTAFCANGLRDTSAKTEANILTLSIVAVAISYKYRLQHAPLYRPIYPGQLLEMDIIQQWWDPLNFVNTWVKGGFSTGNGNTKKLIKVSEKHFLSYNYFGYFVLFFILWI